MKTLEKTYYINRLMACGYSFLDALGLYRFFKCEGNLPELEHVTRLLERSKNVD